MEPDLIEAFIEKANSLGGDFNDGGEFPGWMTAEWDSNELLVVTYEDPDHVKITQKFHVIRAFEEE